ncbi:hypothetical protein [Glaciimonas immobilis]|nr:hypothetical protein [Glaciimonas immobilis]
MTPDNLLTLLNGLPFIDATFKPQVLLTLVASLRSEADQRYLPFLNDYLVPDNALRIYQRLMKKMPTRPESAFLNDSRIELVNKAIRRILEKHPEWNALLTISIEWRKLTTGQISLTNPVFPQFIFLGESAFADELLLEETIVHEMSHVWCGFIAEIIDFQKKNSLAKLTLPSGTKNKSVRGVLFAGLFAAAAIKFYYVEGKIFPKCEDRIAFLENYLSGCIDVVHKSTDASYLGLQINNHLALFLQEQRSKN